MWYDINQQKFIEFIDINERVIAYGDGFFTTMAVIEKQVNWLNYHIQRIETSCLALMLDIDIQLVIKSICQFAEKIEQGILKLIICRKLQPQRGYNFEQNSTHIWLNISQVVLPFLSYHHQISILPLGQAVCLSQQIACSPKPLAGLKLLNAQDKVLASHELYILQKQKKDKNLPIVEGLVQNVNGQWVEGTFCNVFYQLNNSSIWHTPPITQSGINGIMRQVLIRKIQQKKQKVTERILLDKDLAQITQLFFCNAVRGILPIQQLTLLNGNTIFFNPLNKKDFLKIVD